MVPLAVPLVVWFFQQGLPNIKGALVLNARGCAIKMAEMMVNMIKVGISRSNSGSSLPDILSSIEEALQDVITTERLLSPARGNQGAAGSLSFLTQ